jgi:RNA polymerase sigma-70 factor (ECF subfamily)
MITLGNQSDEDLMLLVQKGDELAYAELFARHKRGVYGYTRRFIRDEAQAQEVFQDAWLKVHRASKTYRKGARFKTWLYTITANTTRDAYRQSQRRIQTVDSAIEPTARQTQFTSGMDLQAAIAALPENLREAFLMGAIQGFDHKEVATALDISPSNARARISRARAALRKALKAETNEGGA